MPSLVAASFLLTSDYWDSVIRVSTPIALAAVAATLCSRAGILFVGVEGVMLLSSFSAVAGAIWTGSIWAGVAIAAGTGVVVSLLLGVMSMSLRMGDVVAGLVVDVGALGLGALLLEQLFAGGATIGVHRLGAVWPSFGSPAADVFFHQEPFVYVAILLAFAVAYFLRTRAGLRLRSSGESVRVARTLGVDLVRLRLSTLAVSGAVTGLGGAVTGLAIVGSFNTNIIGGRGFIALACVMLGAWSPIGALAASVLFGAAYSVQFRVHVGGGWLQLVPYALALLSLAVLWGRRQGPAEEGRGLHES